MSDLHADAPDPFWTGLRALLAEVSALAVAFVSFGVLVAGLAFLQKADFDLFGLVWLGLVPLGALLTGILAATGYYAASVLLQVKPTRFTGIAMMLLAALTQVGLYYLHYQWASFGKGLAGFLHYLDLSLREMRFSTTIYGYTLTGARMGVWGYVIAFFQFLALLAGGFIPFSLLADKPYCPKDRVFHKPLTRVSRLFHGGEEIGRDLRESEEGSRTYFEKLRALPEGNDRKVELWLSRCPRCGGEALIEKLFVMKEGKPTYLDVKHRLIWMRTGRSVESEVRGLGLGS